MNSTKKLKIVSFNKPNEPRQFEVEMANLTKFAVNSKTAVLPSGEIYITGGYNKETNQCSSEVFRMNIDERKAVPRANMRIGRCSHGICVIDFNIYVCGGKRNDRVILDSFEKYDAIENKWEILESCEYSTVRPLLMNFTSKRGDEYIYKIGGYTHGGNTSPIFILFYEPNKLF